MLSNTTDHLPGHFTRADTMYEFILLSLVGDKKIAQDAPPTSDVAKWPCRLEQKSETQKPGYKSLRIANPRLPALWLIFRRHCHRNPEFPTSLIIHNTIKSFQPNCMLHGKSSGDTLATRDDELHNCKRWFMIV